MPDTEVSPPAPADIALCREMASLYRKEPEIPVVYARAHPKGPETILVDRELIDLARRTLGIECDLRLAPSFSGYAATDDGRAVSFHWSNRSKPRRFRVLCDRLDHHGYVIFKVRLGDRRRNLRLHSLVADAFRLPRLPEHTEIRHLDGDRLNNAPWNLAWGTHAENMDDSVVHGVSAAGTRNGHAKLTEDQVREIRRLRAEGMTLSKISEKFDYDVGNIVSIVKGRIWRCVL